MNVKRFFSLTLLFINMMMVGVDRIYASQGPIPGQSAAGLFAEGVSPPGWLGGLLTLIALALPLMVYYWMK